MITVLAKSATPNSFVGVLGLLQAMNEHGVLFGRPPEALHVRPEMYTEIMRSHAGGRLHHNIPLPRPGENVGTFCDVPVYITRSSNRVV